MRAREEEREVNRTAKRGAEATGERKMKLSFSLHLPGKRILSLDGQNLVNDGWQEDPQRSVRAEQS